MFPTEVRVRQVAAWVSGVSDGGGGVTREKLHCVLVQKSFHISVNIMN